jgi:hypothetical protein
VSVILKYFSLKGTNAVRDFFHRKVKIFPATSVSTFVLKQFSYGEKSLGRAEVICLHQDFSPPKANFRILIKNVLGIFYTNV